MLDKTAITTLEMKPLKSKDGLSDGSVRPKKGSDSAIYDVPDGADGGYDLPPPPPDYLGSIEGGGNY